MGPCWGHKQRGRYSFSSNWVGNARQTHTPFPLFPSEPLLTRSMWLNRKDKENRYQAFLCISHSKQSVWVAYVSIGYFAMVCLILGTCHGNYLTKYLLRYILQKLAFIFGSAAFCNFTWELENLALRNSYIHMAVIKDRTPASVYLLENIWTRGRKLLPSNSSLPG